MEKYIRPFLEIGLQDVSLVGGKTASLGELYSVLASEGVAVPNGFAVTADAYRDALSRPGVSEELHRLLDGLDKRKIRQLAATAAKARAVVYKAMDTAALREQIVEAYRQLEGEAGAGAAVAVRSSATAEDLPTASFAGQHDSFLNVRGADDLFEACRRCFTSIFTDRAISYRIDKGFDHFKVALSVAVMKMVRSDLASSGVVFTLDTESGFRDVVFVTGCYGLGETIVQGKVDPDEFYVHKPTLKQGFRRVLRRRLGGKQIRMVYGKGSGSRATLTRTVPNAERQKFCISDPEVLSLAEIAVRIEAHYSKHAGMPMPMDIEWAKDGADGKLYIIHARRRWPRSARPACSRPTA
jgi:pyruvate,water dikinase